MCGKIQGCLLMFGRQGDRPRIRLHYMLKCQAFVLTDFSLAWTSVVCIAKNFNFRKQEFVRCGLFWPRFLNKGSNFGYNSRPTACSRTHIWAHRRSNFLSLEGSWLATPLIYYYGISKGKSLARAFRVSSRGEYTMQHNPPDT